LLWYDWAICLGQEVGYIWGSRMSAGKVLYLINRYPVMITTVIAVYCERQFVYLLSLGALTPSLVQDDLRVGVPESVRHVNAKDTPQRR
jgi:hypothetical protein